MTPTKMLFEIRESLTPPKRKRKIILDILIFFAVATAAAVPQNVISTVLLFIILLTNQAFIDAILSSVSTPTLALEEYSSILSGLPSWFYAVLLLLSGVMIIVAILYCRLFEKRSPKTLGFRKEGVLSEYLLGCVIGLLMISAPVTFCYFTGFVQIELTKSANPFMIVIFLLCFLAQGMGEEALFRGYLMTSLLRRHKIWVAILWNSLLFSLFHLGNASFSLLAFFNIFLFGAFASIFMLKRGSIWAVGAIHSIWNFAQGNLFGFNVSGNPKFDSVLTSAQSAKGVWLHGGDFGPEGGFAVTVLLCISILIALSIPTKKSEAIQPEQLECIR